LVNYRVTKEFGTVEIDVFGTVELERSWKNGSRAVPNTP
jgi:hypothetical protein